MTMRLVKDCMFNSHHIPVFKLLLLEAIIRTEGAENHRQRVNDVYSWRYAKLDALPNS